MQSDRLNTEAFAGLERLSGAEMRNRIHAAPASPGMERIEARFRGPTFAPHRHDTYGLAITPEGVQTFHYRGARRYSRPGQLVILHPDEVHDGGAATDDGLRYRMLYLEPALLRRGLGRDNAPLPFVADPVVSDADLRVALMAAVGPLDDMLEDLLVDDLVGALARGLARHARQEVRALGPLAVRAGYEARDYLAANANRAVRSTELEAVTGLDRFALNRHFRALFATSPHRYLLMRRLQRARALIGAGEPLAEVAAATGFADQSHLTRHFKKAYGLPPGQWARMIAADAERAA